MWGLPCLQLLCCWGKCTAAGCASENFLCAAGFMPGAFIVLKEGKETTKTWKIEARSLLSDEDSPVASQMWQNALADAATRKLERNVTDWEQCACAFGGRRLCVCSCNAVLCPATSLLLFLVFCLSSCSAFMIQSILHAGPSSHWATFAVTIRTDKTSGLLWVSTINRAQAL